MNKKGFTLAELLAVVSLIVVIALIVIPVVANYINSSKNSAKDISVSEYIKAVENAILRERLEKNSIIDGEYTIQSDGSICYNNNCIEIKLKNIPDISGTITIESEEIDGYLITLNDKAYRK